MPLSHLDRRGIWILSGIGAFVMNFVVGRLVGRVRNRYLMTIGFILLGSVATGLILFGVFSAMCAKWNRIVNRS